MALLNKTFECHIKVVELLNDLTEETNSCYHHCDISS